MAKHSRDQEESQRPIKRAKVDQTRNGPAVEEIHFARQLQQLLAFRQDGIQQLRNGIASFKVFLESILYHKDADNRARQLSILRGYLDSQKPADINDTDQPFLNQLWQSWSFASQENNDYICSSISSVIALLLKALSSLLDFRDHGLLLCRTVLQHQHLRLLRRCLDAPKHKDFLISPCLRLLIEVTSFDGGVLARDVYKRREQTFETGSLRRNLAVTRTDMSEEEARRRPAIRTLSIRYILTQFKYLHEGAKTDLLKSRPLCTALFRFLHEDPADVINELLAVTEQHVLKDDELPRSAKAALLVQHNLERITEVATRSAEGHSAAERAFAWLKGVCSNHSYGILRKSGWYPPGTDRMDNCQQRDNIIDLGLDGVDVYDGDQRPSVRNTTLLAWIKTLRPQSSTQERELVLTCFRSAPELVAAYFAEKNMQLDPKLSNTWVGYASFLFESTRLPVPEYLGGEKGWAQLPPETNIMIENILPQPLTQKTLTRCLNQSSELITFFSIRLLVVAFEKLLEIRSQIEKGATSKKTHRALWNEALERLQVLFLERCPTMKDVITTFRKIPDDNEHMLQREAVTRLLRLFYEVTPLQAIEEHFDVSAPLTSALVRSEEDQDSGATRELRTLELQHLLHIAMQSPGMRWFSKQGSLEFSPILTLLKLHSKDFENRQIRNLIFHVLSENNVANSSTACDALIALLQGTEDLVNIGPFLDECFVRASRQPVKYLDHMDEIVKSASSDQMSETKLPSILAVVFLEQAPFVVGKPNDVKEELEAFMSHYIQLLMYSEEQSHVLEAIQKRLVDLDGFEWPENSVNLEATLSGVRLEDPSLIGQQHPSVTETEGVTLPFTAPPTESENHPELYTWANKDLDMAIEDGDVDALLLCLCSQHLDIRTQVLVQLRKLEDKLLKSAIEDKDPVYVLIGELLETYEHHYIPKAEPLAHLVGCFTTHALRVLREPTHYMYPKINRFLNKGPEWRVSKLPNYWLDNTMLSLPEEDDAYWKEVQWVLDWLVDGVRTSADLEILRRAGVFEKVMSLYCSPSAHKHMKEKVLELIWRATFVDGGSNTLITRTGVLAWLDMVQKSGNSWEAALKRRIVETCDREKIEEWSGSSVDKL